MTHDPSTRSDTSTPSDPSTRPRPSGSTPLRERILDAATELISEQGWSAVTMAALGAIAGVSRQSVYNEVGSKPALAEALVMREFERFLAAVDTELQREQNLTAAIEHAALAVYRMAEENPLLIAMVSSAYGGNSDLLPLLTTDAQPLIGAATSLLGLRIRELHPDLGIPDQQLASAVDAIVRIVLSNVMQPGASPRQSARDASWIATRLLHP